MKTLRHCIAEQIADIYGDGGQRPDTHACYGDAEYITRMVVKAINKPRKGIGGVKRAKLPLRAVYDLEVA
jgi:hypothetical protein